MKQILLLLPVLLVLLILIGCGRNAEEAAAFNQENANHPRLVLTMPDGRQLYRIVIDSPDIRHYHYVYFFDKGDKTISVNYSVSQGKTTRNQTIVIDGVTYKAIETNN